ncbi:glucose-6-phosphate isomerase, partial [Ochrobactrum sp. SFR4]|nr:glucose-6-phosphate isomerase [Ochrobactrum sp. SFR4]
LKMGDLLLDWSKCRINDQTMVLLKDLAVACNVEGQRDAMFAGELINTTENRAVLHVALRAKPDDVIVTGGENVVPEV